MDIKIVFQGCPSSAAIEAHVHDKAAKIADLLKKEAGPQTLEVHLKAHTNHAHQEVVMHLKAKEFDLTAHQEMPDMYQAIDKTMEKMIAQVKTEKDRLKDKHRAGNGDKNSFYS